VREDVVKKKRKGDHKTGKDGILDKHMMMIALIEGNERVVRSFFIHIYSFVKE
jgi:hypothetical protein